MASLVDLVELVELVDKVPYCARGWLTRSTKFSRLFDLASPARLRDN
jgi:hypothetical protein